MKAGQIGFTFHQSEITSEGIGWFERWDMTKGMPPVSHTFLLTGNGMLVEAHETTGVQTAEVSKYLTDPSCKTYFRTPVGLTNDIDTRLTTQAMSHIGAKYATNLIGLDAVTGTYVGHLLDKLFKEAPDHFIAKALANPHAFICSSLVATCLSALPEYTGKGCLANPPASLDPQQIFVDSVIFEEGFECGANQPPSAS